MSLLFVIEYVSVNLSPNNGVMTCMLQIVLESQTPQEGNCLVTEEVSEEMRDSLVESLPTAWLQIGQAPLHSPC